MNKENDYKSFPISEAERILKEKIREQRELENEMEYIGDFF